MNISPATRYSLLIRIQDAQNHAAWIEFIALYEPLVYRLARRKGLQDSDARDLCQEVFRAVATAIERWDPDPAKGRFRAWLFRIARNLALKFLAHKDRRLGGTGRTTIQEMLEAQPDTDPRAEAEFALE